MERGPVELGFFDFTTGVPVAGAGGVGALFLSGLGLAVVAFMVLVTTRRAELLERYKHARSMLENREAERARLR